MAPAVIRSTVQLPFQLLNAVFKRLRLLPKDAPANHTFPVAGLDEARAHAVLYALRHASTSVQVRLVCNLSFSCLSSGKLAGAAGGADSRTMAGSTADCTDCFRQVCLQNSLDALMETWYGRLELLYSMQTAKRLARG